MQELNHDEIKQEYVQNLSQFKNEVNKMEESDGSE